ncbi:MAG: threonine synthase [Firmicutes bacterium]|nr:threonine synthase [Bacillota bacterium]
MTSYISTRGNYPPVSASAAIKVGMVPAGGLFVPDEIPVFTNSRIFALTECDYLSAAREVIAPFLDDFTADELSDCLKPAYGGSNFHHPLIAPLHSLTEKVHFLELWHGPTAAFKDLALQVMPFLLTRSAAKLSGQKEIIILVATSGDTGKAALEGFKNVPGTRIIVFYPYRKVSKIQELQMTTTDGDNTYVVAVKGNFDDCQSAVKEIFADQRFNRILADEGFELSSANSINWGRLVPQIVYYFWAYAGLLKKKIIAPGEKINFVVPTGNFGNILAGWYAQKMGLPIHKLLCASNKNKVLTDFFHTGFYDRNRKFWQTRSPSMDILISSNLERFLFEITGHDAEKITHWMKELAEKGSFRADKKLLGDSMIAGFADEEETLEAIREVFNSYNYLLDTHTAVGYKVYQDYCRKSGDNTVTVINATASPYKFAASVLEAIQGKECLQEKDEFAILRRLEELDKGSLHPGLQNLQQKPILHRTICEKGEIRGQIEKILLTGS